MREIAWRYAKALRQLTVDGTSLKQAAQELREFPRLWEALAVAFYGALSVLTLAFLI